MLFPDVIGDPLTVRHPWRWVSLEECFTVTTLSNRFPRGFECDFDDLVLIWAGSLSRELLVLTSRDLSLESRELVARVIQRMKQGKSSEDPALAHLATGCDQCLGLAIEAINYRLRQIRPCMGYRLLFEVLTGEDRSGFGAEHARKCMFCRDRLAILERLFPV
jgi:hypothetical protein